MHPYLELLELAKAYNSLIVEELPYNYDIQPLNALGIIKAARNHPENQWFVFLGKNSTNKVVARRFLDEDGFQTLKEMSKGVGVLRKGEAAYAGTVIKHRQAHPFTKDRMNKLYLYPDLWEEYIKNNGIVKWLKHAGKVLPRAGYPEYVLNAYKIAVFRGVLQPLTQSTFPFSMDKYSDMFMWELVHLFFEDKLRPHIVIEKPINLYNPDNDVVKMVANRLFVTPKH